DYYCAAWDESLKSYIF
nr:immunoglobulin light chain junction region [Macaca mulatta]MOV97514.1 immunoglobulin light chain junction region [Macaca mulatta]